MDFPVSHKPMAEIIRNFDWGATPLGPIQSWSVPLRTVVNLMLESDFPKAIVWGPELITLYNDAFVPILGEKPLAIGRPFSDVWSEAWETIGPIAAKAFRGESTFIENFPLTVDRHESPEQAYFSFCYSPIRDESGHVVGMMDTVIETTGVVTARQTETLLRQELVHRVKNMLTVASAIVNSSPRHAETIESGAQVVGERLATLAAAQELTSSTGKSVELATLIRTTIDPHIGDNWDRLHVGGPDIVLGDDQATALSLVLYELATNAVKYGALSAATGRVDITWSANEEGRFDFSWAETGVENLGDPGRAGFGSQLMTRMAPAYFGGEAAREFHRHGLHYRLSGDLADANRPRSSGG